SPATSARDSPHRGSPAASSQPGCSLTFDIQLQPCADRVNQQPPLKCANHPEKLKSSRPLDSSTNSRLQSAAPRSDCESNWKHPRRAICTAATDRPIGQKNLATA